MIQVNTYLPYADFTESVSCLDDSHLNRMRADVIKILTTLGTEPTEEHPDSPIVKMWRGNDQALVRLGMAICIEWSCRGNTDNTLRRVMMFKSPMFPGENPEWLDEEAFHDSHKSWLLRSKPRHYRQFWPDFPDDKEMLWPRSPEKLHVTGGDKQQEKLVARAIKLKDQLARLKVEAHDAAVRAGLDPDTLQPMSEIEADPELAAL